MDVLADSGLTLIVKTSEAGNANVENAGNITSALHSPHYIQLNFTNMSV